LDEHRNAGGHTTPAVSISSLNKEEYNNRYAFSEDTYDSMITVERDFHDAKIDLSVGG
jgi:hypothetical protein